MQLRWSVPRLNEGTGETARRHLQEIARDLRHRYEATLYRAKARVSECSRLYEVLAYRLSARRLLRSPEESAACLKICGIGIDETAPDVTDDFDCLQFRRLDALRREASRNPEARISKGAPGFLLRHTVRLLELLGARLGRVGGGVIVQRTVMARTSGVLVTVNMAEGEPCEMVVNVGPEAAKPMQEGISVLFKRLADIDVFDLELRTTDPVLFIETVRLLEPTFGGIDLKDIRAPEGLYIHDRLSECLNIPVFHENLYGTAVVAAAALIDALDLVEKRMEDIRIVICGAGTVGTGCARILTWLGSRPENLLACDLRGVLHPERDDLQDFQRPFAQAHSARDLSSGIRGADVFIGASSAGILTQDMVRSMGRFHVGRPPLPENACRTL